MTEEPITAETAETWKAKGNDLYKVQKYVEAVNAYSMAIGMDPSNALLFINRAAAQLMALNFKEAVNDCDSAIRLDNSCSKAYFRKATALKRLGRLDAAIDSLNKGLEHEPQSAAAEQDRAQLVATKDKLSTIKELIRTKRFSSALTQTDGLIKEVGAAFPEVTLLRIECLLHTSRPEEAFNQTNMLMKGGHGGDVQLLNLRAKCLLAMGDVDNSYKHLQQAMRSDPDNTVVRMLFRTIKEVVESKNTGDDAFKLQRFEEAIQCYSRAITAFGHQETKCDSFVAKIFLNRATSLHKLRRHAEAIQDCHQALLLNGRYQKALLRRGECYMALGDPQSLEKAIADLEAAKDMEEDEDSARGLAQKIKKAKVLLKRSKRKDLYALLGVTAEASESEIKTAYRKAALRYHPDKQSAKSDEEKAEAESKFKEINQAYEILANPEKKARYDEGVEMEDLDNPHAGGGCGGGGFDGGGIDPNMFFHFMQQQQQQRGGGRGGFFR